MKRLNILAASLTLSAAAFAANGAWAACADELAQLKSEVGSMANTGSAASGMQASGRLGQREFHHERRFVRERQRDVVFRLVRR